MPLFTSKVTPAHQEQSHKRIEDHRYEEERKKRTAKVYVMLLQILLKRYGGRRHPKIDPFDVLMNEKLLTELVFVPRGSVILYISHQWVGIHHPDPRGDQFYHLLLLLERLLKGDVSRTDMDAFHSLVYKHNYTTTAKDWKRILDPEKTFIFYEGFCVPNDEREHAGASIHYRTFLGSTLLVTAVDNEDSDPNVVRLVLEKLKDSYSAKELTSVVNYKRTSTTWKWRGIYSVAKVLYRTGASKGGLMKSLAIDSGTTALNLAVVRGDIEIVKILLDYGADPYVENDLGINAFEMCDEAGPFPSVRKVLEEARGERE